jgi:Ser/Thr protein kinase RdoA (MazF antagonist)
VYLCRRQERAHVIKFIPLALEKALKYEEKIQFITFLAENGVNVSHPLSSQQGRLLEQVVDDNQTYGVLLTTFANGIILNAQRTPNEWNELLFFRWGKLMGKMHALARVYPYWYQPNSNLPGKPDAVQPATQLNDWKYEDQHFNTLCSEPRIAKEWQDLMPQLESLPRTRASFGLIHNDFHHKNLFYDPRAHPGREITVIDFDVCGYHWFLNDIATSLYHAMLESVDDQPGNRAAFTKRFMTAFQRGYNQENDLDRSWLKQLNLFLKHRQILVYLALSESWPPGKRPRWQETFLGRMRRAITTRTPVLPEEFIAHLG